MDTLFFTGIKHSGKTTFALRIGSRLGLDAKDSDELVTPLLGGLSVREYYRKFGLSVFKIKEAKAVEDYAKAHPEPFVLSLGGGACDNEPLMAVLKKVGKVIYLARNEKDMLPVILAHGVPAFLDANDVEGSFHKLYERRDRLYREHADLTIKLGCYKDVDETEEYIWSVLKENGYVR